MSRRPRRLPQQPEPLRAAVADEEVEAEELLRLLRQRHRPHPQMVTHHPLLPLLELLRVAEVGEEAGHVVGIQLRRALPRQLQPMVLWHHPFLLQQADVVAEAVALLRQLLWK